MPWWTNTCIDVCVCVCVCVSLCLCARVQVDGGFQTFFIDTPIYRIRCPILTHTFQVQGLIHGLFGPRLISVTCGVLKPPAETPTFFLKTWSSCLWIPPFETHENLSSWEFLWAPPAMPRLPKRNKAPYGGRLLTTWGHSFFGGKWKSLKFSTSIWRTVDQNSGWVITPPKKWWLGGSGTRPPPKKPQECRFRNSIPEILPRHIWYMWIVFFIKCLALWADTKHST